jgi:hypothetical protein
VIPASSKARPAEASASQSSSACPAVLCLASSVADGPGTSGAGGRACIEVVFQKRFDLSRIMAAKN